MHKLFQSEKPNLRSLFTALGDLAAGGVAGFPVRLPKGTNGSFLGVNNSGDLEWAVPNPYTSGVAASNAGTLGPLTSSAWTTIPFDTEASDTLSEYNPATYTFTPQTTGFYLWNISYNLAPTLNTDRCLCAIWTGTASTLVVVSDGYGVLKSGGTILVPLTGGTGYTVRTFPVSYTPTLQASGSMSIIRVR